MICNTTFQNMLDAVKAAFKEKIIVLSSYIGGKGMKINVVVSNHLKVEEGNNYSRN